MEKYQEPEERVSDYNPLDEAVNEKRYTQSSVNTEGVDFTKPIEEPRFTPPPFEQKKFEQPKKPTEPVNPELKNLNKKDTQMASAQACKLILQGYSWVHDLANRGLQVSEKKLNKLQADGEINLNAMIDYDYGKKVRAGDFFEEYNRQVSGILQVSDEFKEEVTPILERVLAKRGIGLTDEQTLMYLFGKDIASKSIIFFQQKTQLNYMIQSIKEATTSQFVQEAPPQQDKKAKRDEREERMRRRMEEREKEISKEPEEESAEPVKAEVVVLEKTKRKTKKI